MAELVAATLSNVCKDEGFVRGKYGYQYGTAGLDIIRTREYTLGDYAKWLRGANRETGPSVGYSIVNSCEDPEFWKSRWEPGTCPTYSNSGDTLLGLIFEKTT
ncbi:hypothetical protein BH23BAC3_BH23BAC3_28350 [soil metagenome]